MKLDKKPAEKHSSAQQVHLKKTLSFSKLFPNIITLTAICSGLSSIRYALNANWEVCAMLIIIAGFLDLVDGRLARYLKATSSFGAYLDSLADFINFGVAPAIVLYLWNLQNITFKGVGWALVLFFSICMSIRLARFNTSADDAGKDVKSLKRHEMFFKGVPAPAGAYLAIIPMVVSFRFEIDFSQYLTFLSIYMVSIALLIVSTIPTFSIKKLTITREQVPLFFVGFGLIIAIMLTEPWVLLPVMGALYLIHMPYSAYIYKKHYK